MKQRTGKATIAGIQPAPSSGFRPGETADCDNCGAEMSLQRGLTYLGRNRTGLVVVANLEGFKCHSCGRDSWTPPSYETIQTALRREPPGFGAHAKISKLARNNLGAYFPKDLQEHMGMHAGDQLIMQPLDERFMLVEISHESEEDKAKDSA